MSPGSNPGARLRELLAGPEPLMAPGAFDGLSARLIEEAGFDAVYMTGFGAAAAILGRPDVGLLTMTEMVDHARQISQAVSPLPVIADADTGYGNPISVIRTIQQYELAGVAGFHLEDQVAPKKCGHMAGKEVIPRNDMVSKIKAAVDARRSADFVIIARTDARAVEGLESALDRAKSYRDAGADVLFIEAPEGIGEIEVIAKTFSDMPLLYNWAEGGKTPPLTYDEIRQLGFKMIIFPVGALLSATQAIREVLKSLR
ncbi:MAG: isocitrate lyase/PEP mutase family protein, partial [Acidimicrobiaceae bacterium]|nr:isocitrate lyase/PEP mutase family protein [Acidimicrobiaceae bacterium]